MFLGVNLYVGYFYEVANTIDHASDRGAILFDDRMVHLVDAKGVKSLFLHLGSLDAALYLSDFYLCHD